MTQQTPKTQAAPLTRKTLEGKVLSTAMQKTIVVSVERFTTHPIYRKQHKVVKNFHVHDTKSQAQVGDLVLIEATRPISKLKRWRLKEIIKHS